jgi:predicted deacylase
MRIIDERIGGDTPGTEFRLRVHRYEGRDPAAPRAYLQAALHAGELPGVAALHVLLPMIARAEAEGRLLGSVTAVPQANPIGAGQNLFGEHQGRFSLASRTNFNRDFPLIDRPDADLLPGDDAPIAADDRLKARLLALSLGHEIVLDLHCDDQGPCYLYVEDRVWPGLSDLAAALDCAAVIVWDTTSDGAFDEAALRPYAMSMPADAVARRAVTTVELRGTADVSPDLARADADGLYRFLVHRGVVRDTAVSPPAAWTGPAVPIANVEMVKAPAAGAILYEVAPGDRVREGDVVARVLVDPGVGGGETAVVAPQGGLVLTRRSQRLARRGDDIAKILGTRRAAGARPGTLED